MATTKYAPGTTLRYGATNGTRYYITGVGNGTYQVTDDLGQTFTFPASTIDNGAFFIEGGTPTLPPPGPPGGGAAAPGEPGYAPPYSHTATPTPPPVGGGLTPPSAPAPGGMAGSNQPGGANMGSAEQGGNPAYLEDPGLWRGLYEQQMGIPTAGRNRYAKWLADQFNTTVADYMAQSEGLGGAPTAASFTDYLTGLGGTPRRASSSAYGAFTTMPQSERDLAYERFGPDVVQQLYESSLRGRYAPYLASALSEQRFAAPAQRRYEVSPGGQQATGSFLDYLLGQFGV